MKILIIHPKDSSTDFLKPIYQSLIDDNGPGVGHLITLITGGMSKSRVRLLIEEYDQIIMLGHGSPGGLFSMGNFENTQGSYIIDETMLTSLGTKPNIFIWCHADRFVNKYYLKGFYSGMFISEVTEAEYEGLHDITQEIVDKSNNTFAKILGNWINQPMEEMYRYVKDRYAMFALDDNNPNPVTIYNANRLYYKK